MPPEFAGGNPLTPALSPKGERKKFARRAPLPSAASSPAPPPPAPNEDRLPDEEMADVQLHHLGQRGHRRDIGKGEPVPGVTLKPELDAVSAAAARSRSSSPGLPSA